MSGRGTVGALVLVLWAAHCLAAEVPDDPYFELQWALHNVGQKIEGQAGLADADIDAPEAWGIHSGLSSVTVAIVGRGVDPHPEFADRLLEGRAFVGDLFNTLDTCPHDTHLAGIIAAATDNGVGVAGMNRQARLLPVRGLDGCGGSTADVAEGILWAVDEGATVVLVPVQFAEGSVQLANAVAYAVAHDVLVIAPAGSTASNEVAYPARYDGCLAVSATTNEDRLSLVSNYGPQVDLAAPGEHIWSTWIGGDYAFQPGGRDTASASAFAAGAAALIRSYAPQLTASQVRDVLLASADGLGDPGWDPSFGAGRLNLHRALEMAPPPALRFEPVGSYPALLPPGLDTAFIIRIADVAESLDPGSALLFHRRGDGAFSSAPLEALGEGSFAVALPTLSCGESLQYYLQAQGNSGTMVREPLDAPVRYHAATAMKRGLLFSDDFETDLHWQVDGGDSGSGRWERVIPVGTSAQPGFDFSPDAGRNCYVTGQHFGGHYGTNDVDAALVQLTSPVITVRGDDVEISYARWFVWNGQGAEDFLTVEFSLDDGKTWTTAETVSSTGAWVHHSFRLSGFPEVSGNQLRVRYSVTDDGNDSLTEAAVDEFRVAALWCAVDRGDVNGDGSVDPEDHASGVDCWTGPGDFFRDAACDAMDYDRNHHIDLADFWVFQRLVSRLDP